jgi:hypothetical protein
VLRPDHTTASVVLPEIEPGVFEGSFLATLPGTYHCRVTAHGSTYRGTGFTREQALTGAVFQGGDGPPPYGGPAIDPGREAWCRLLHCLLADKQLAGFLKRHDIDPERLTHCLKWLCEEQRPAEGQPGKAKLRDVQHLLENPVVLDMVRSLMRESDQA